MSKEEILKIQKYVLKVNIHCGGCKQKIKKILKKIDGVFITEIDAQQGMVTVYGNVGPNIVIKKLAKSGKYAAIWGNPNANNNNNQNNIANHMKNMQIDNENGGGNNNNNTATTTNNNNLNSEGPPNNLNQLKGSVGGQHQQGQNPQHQQFQQQQQRQNPQHQLQQQQQQQQQIQQQLQQLQHMKGFGELNVPQFKDMNTSIKMPPNKNPNMKGVKLSLPEDDDFSDDEIDDESDNEMDNPQHPLNKMKLPMGGNGPTHMMMNGGNPFQLMNPQKDSENNRNGGGNGMESGGGGLGTIQFQGLGGGNDGSNGGNKGGGGGNHYSQNQVGGNINNGGKNEGGMPEGKNGNTNVVGGASGGTTKILNNNEFPNMRGQSHHPNMLSMGNTSGIPMGGAMGTNMSMINQMGGKVPAVQGLFASAMTGNGGSGVPAGGYGGPEMMMSGNPYQQQYMASMMNQQREIPIGGVNERFQPMMYAKPPMAANYMYPPPYNYPPPPQYHQDPYSNYFNDENTSSCSIM